MIVTATLLPEGYFWSFDMQTPDMTTINAIPASRPMFRAWLAVALLCVVGCLNYLDRIMITTMRESIVSAISITDTQFGMLTSVFLWVYGLLSPFAGFLADRFSRSRVIIISLFVWSAVTWLTAHATTYEQLLATRALMGISEACYIPAALALITDYHRGPTRSLATGIHMAGIMFGQSLGFVGGWIAERSDWSHAFSLFGIVGIVYAFILFFFLRDAPQRQTAATTERPVNFREGVRNLFSTRAYWLALAFWGLIGVVNWMIVSWLPTYYKEQFNLSQSIAGLYATGYFHTASLLGVLAGGAWADRWSRSNPRARILVPAIGLAIAAPCILMASSTDVLVLAITGFVMFAFTRTFTDANMMPILCLISDSGYRATGYGILNMVGCIVGGIGIYAGGALRDADVNLRLVFQLAAGVALLCVLVLLLIRPKAAKGA
ncbi:MFS transporter [Chitinophaga sp.]|uniref:MFS transporter n=1 Tax=Chitinophaga sp. TaxID=1869181 RepID=UPI0031D7A9B9